MNLTEAADYLHVVSIDPAMSFTPARRARLGEVEDAMRAAVAPEVVAEALEVNGPDRAFAHDSVWTPDRILEMLAEHGLKVVRS